MVKLIKNISKFNDKKIFIIIVVFSIAQLISYGLEPSDFLFYNMDWYYKGLYRQAYPDDIYLKFSSSLKLVEFITFHFRPLFQLPILFVFSSIVIRVLIIFVAYKISLSLVSDKYIAIFATLFYFVSFYTHGLAGSSGMWGPLIFSKASIAAFFVVLGIYSTIIGRIYLSCVFFSLSIQLHPINSATALIYYFAGYSYNIFKSDKKLFKNILILILVVIINTLPIVIWTKHSINVPFAEVSIKDWYNYLYCLDPDDLSLLYTFLKYGYILVPLLMSALYLSIKSYHKSKLDFLYIGMSCVLFVFMVLELLQKGGIFFGKLSEYFIILEFRRGLWIITFFATVIAFREIYRNFSLKDILIDKKLLFMLVISLIIYIKPTLFNVSFLAILLITLVPNVYIKIGSLLTIIFIISIYFIGKCEPILNMSDNIKYTVFTFICSTLFFLFIILKQRKLKIIFMLPLCLFVGMGLVKGYYKDIFFNSYSIVANRGLFKYPDHDKLIITYNSQSGNDVAVDMIEAIKKENKGHNKILMPMIAQTYSDIYLYKALSHLSINDVVYPLLSKKYFAYLVYKLQELDFFCNNFNELKYDSKDSIHKVIDENYSKLTINKLNFLKDKYGIKIFVTTKEYKELELIYRDTKYFVYLL